MHVAGTVPPYIVGLIYLSLIPIYALIYAFWIPTEFFHSTATSEQSYRDRLILVERELQETIISDLQLAYGGASVAFAEGRSACLSRIRLQGFDTNSVGYPTFRLFVPIGITTAGGIDPCAEGSIATLEVLQAESLIVSDKSSLESAFYTAAAQNWLVVTLSPIGSNSELLGAFPQPVDTSVFRTDSDRIYYAFALPASINAKIVDLANASLGSPSGIPAEFWRMIHLSSATVTTTGYGDIVPLTTRARLLTSSESIFGLVLIGFFLNSVSHARTERRKQQAVT